MTINLFALGNRATSITAIAVLGVMAALVAPRLRPARQTGGGRRRCSPREWGWARTPVRKSASCSERFSAAATTWGRQASMDASVH